LEKVQQRELLELKLKSNKEEVLESEDLNQITNASFKAASEVV
jgi:hypothetical protein